MALARNQRPDVLVMDVRMPDLDGITATRLITADPELAGVRVVVLTTYADDANVYAALQAGASGFLVVAAAARGAARSPSCGRRARLLPGCGGLFADQGVKRGAQTGPSPVDRGRAGSKHHLITKATGVPLAIILTGANRNDVTQLRPLLDAIPKVRGKRGRPRQRPDVVLADRGYDHDKYRNLVRELQIRPLIARRGTEHGSGRGKQR